MQACVLKAESFGGSCVRGLEQSRSVRGVAKELGSVALG